MLEHEVLHETNETYKSAFRSYLAFCDKFHAVPLPATEMTLVYWLAYRTTEVQANSALSNYYGVKKLAKYHGYPINDTKWYHLQAAKTTMETIFGANTPDQRLPVTFNLLTKMYPYFNMKNYNDFLIFTMMVLATTGLCRSSEIFAKNKQVSPTAKTRSSIKALWNRNLTPVKDDTTKRLKYYTCTIRATKTEKGHCDVDIVWGKGKFPIAPAQLLTQYLALRIMQLAKTHPQLSSAPHAPLFQLLDGTIVTVADMRNRFNILCKQMKLDMKKYTVYSFRIGGATSMARRGVGHKEIQIAGRWTSDAYKLYI